MFPLVNYAFQIVFPHTCAFICAVMSEDMVNNGYCEIVNIDISSVVIAAMQSKYKDFPQLKCIHSLLVYG